MHFHFVPAGIVPKPSTVCLQLHASDFDLDHVAFELLGMTGDVSSSSEVGIVVQSDGSFEEGNSLTLRAQFPDGLFAPTVQNNAYFGESDGISRGVVLVLILLVVTIIAFIAVIIKIYMRTKLSDGTIKKWPSISEIPVKHNAPFKMSLPAIYYLVKQSSPFYTNGVSTAFGSYLLKWSYEGIIKMTKVKSSYVITLHPLQTDLPEIEYMLYKILKPNVDNHRQTSSNANKQ